MIDPLAHVIATFLALVLAALIPHRSRPSFTAFAGFVFLAVYASGSAALLILTLFEALLICRVVIHLPRSNKWRKYLPYILLLNLFFVDFHRFLLGFYVDTVGASFAIIRLFMTSKQLVASRKDLRGEYFKWLFAGTFYLPAIIIGPVFSGLDLRKQALKGEQRLKRVSRTYRHIASGLILAVLVSPFVGNFGEDRFPAEMFWQFLSLFAAFWGQSLIAENTSLLFGYKLPQNFNKPWLAQDIRDFWRRWHASMAQFIMQYIYLPLNVNGISAKLATIIAFVFMGLWHEVAPGYLIWGVSHGLLMAFWPEHKQEPERWVRWVERTVTLSLVVTLSYVANHML